jgi:hypothetical protein
LQIGYGSWVAKAYDIARHEKKESGDKINELASSSNHVREKSPLNVWFPVKSNFVDV